MQRVALINWTNKNQDYDLAKILKSLAVSWIAEWLEVQNWKVLKGYAFIDITRDWLTFPVLFENTEEHIIDTSWDKKIFIEISQSNINDGSNNSSNWTGIWEIKTAVNYPGSNFIKLASITAGVITDERVFVNLKDFGQTNQWNAFNWPDQLVQTNKDWKVPSELIWSPIVNKIQSKLIAWETIVKWDALCQLGNSFEYKKEQSTLWWQWNDLAAGTQDLYTFTAEYSWNVKSIQIYGLTRWSNTNNVKLLLTDTQNTIIDTSNSINWNSAPDYRTHTFSRTNTLVKWNTYKIRVNHTYKMDINSIGSNNIDFFHKSIFIWKDSTWKIYKTDSSNKTRLNFIWFAVNDAILWEEVNVTITGIEWNKSNLKIWSNYYLNQNRGPAIIEQTTKSVWLHSWASNEKFGQTFTVKYPMSFSNFKMRGWFYSWRIATMKLYDSIWWTLIKAADNTYTWNWQAWNDINFSFSNVYLEPWVYYLECTHNSWNSWYVYGSNSSSYSGGWYVQNWWDASPSRDMGFTITWFNSQVWIWKIWTTPWNNAVKIWTAISNSELLIHPLWEINDNNYAYWSITVHSVNTQWITISHNLWKIPEKIICEATRNNSVTGEFSSTWYWCKKNWHATMYRNGSTARWIWKWNGAWIFHIRTSSGNYVTHWKILSVTSQNITFSVDAYKESTHLLFILE